MTVAFLWRAQFHRSCYWSTHWVAAKPAQARDSSRAASGSGGGNSGSGDREGSGGDGDGDGDLHAILANIQDIRHCKTYGGSGH